MSTCSMLTNAIANLQGVYKNSYKCCNVWGSCMYLIMLIKGENPLLALCMLAIAHACTSR